MIWNDFAHWAQEYSRTAFGYLVYRRMFTPYEQQQAFSDESEYVNNHYETGIIVDVIPLCNEDWLLGIRAADDETGELYSMVNYYKLSEIRLVRFIKEFDKGEDDSEL